MLEETESGRFADKKGHSHKFEQSRLTITSFVENLDKNKLFEELFTNICDSRSLPQTGFFNR